MPPLARGLPFARMKRAILGERYELSMAFIPASAMQKHNRAHRAKDASTDVLAFSLAPDMGELLFSTADVRRKAPGFGMSARAYLAFLFIHGCLHLTGLDHGRRMEREEKKRCKQFRIAHPSEIA